MLDFFFKIENHAFFPFCLKEKCVMFFISSTVRTAAFFMAHVADFMHCHFHILLGF